MEFCHNCLNNFPLSNFYIYSSGEVYKNCISCHNAKKYVKKKTGFQKLESSLQDKIKADIGKFSLKAVAEKHSINYITLFRWKQQGQF